MGKLRRLLQIQAFTSTSVIRQDKYQILGSVWIFYCSTMALNYLVFFSVLSDPEKRLEYDINGIYEIDKYSLQVRNFVIMCYTLDDDN